MSSNQPQAWTGRDASTYHPAELLKGPGSRRSLTPRQIAETRPEDEEQLDDYSALYRAALEGVSTRSMVRVTAVSR